MFYVIFDNVNQVRVANVKWINARRLAGIRDTKGGKPASVEITTAWDNGRIMNDGRIACQVPSQWTFEFIQDREVVALSEDDFPPKVYEGADLPPT